jgi:hypothetical protein
MLVFPGLTDAMSDIFDPDEIEAITGLTQPAAQEEFLVSMGLRAFRNKANRVVLAREVFCRWQLGAKVQTEQHEPQLRPIGHGKTQTSPRRHG